MEVKVQPLTRVAFKPFGEIIGKQDDKPPISEADFGYWPGISTIQLSNNVAQLSLLEVVRPRPFICEKLECHLYCSEGIIPLEGQSIIVFGLSKNGGGNSSQVDLETISAFIFDGTRAVNIKKGVWHWLPYPLSEKASFVIILARETHINDMKVVDLKKEYGLEIRLCL